MSNDGKHGLLKYISILGTKTQREYVDHSTERSRPQQRRLRTKDTDTNYSPSPSTKRKRRLTTEENPNPSKKTQQSHIKMSTNKQESKQCKKLSPDLEDLRSEVEDMISPLQASINILLELKTSWELSMQECATLRSQNTQLHTRITKVENENKLLNVRVQRLEDKLLESHVVLHGVPDTLWEPMETTREKVLTAISHTISGESHEARMDQAKKIPIKEIHRMGKFSAMRTRPVVVEFIYKTDANYLISNRTHLPQGVFINRQYTEETERE